MDCTRDQFKHEVEKAFTDQRVEGARIGVGSTLILDLSDRASVSKSYSRVDCVWRLETNLVVLAASQDSRTTLIDNVKSLMGSVITEAEVLLPGLDLRLSFDDKLTLRVFPIHANTDEYENWEIHTPDRIALLAGPGSRARKISIYES